MIRHYSRKLRKSERGATMVEFAIIALLLFTLIFGIIEFGWIFNGYVTLTSAVREGARQAIVVKDKNENARNEIRQIVKNHARTFNLSDGEIIVEFGDFEQETIVEVIGAELPLLIGFFPFINNPYQISAKATMRQEQ